MPRKGRHRRQGRRELFEALERRELFSLMTKLPPQAGLPREAAIHLAARGADSTLAIPAKKNGAHPDATSPPGGSFTPANLRTAYGMDQVAFGTTAGDGRGQTIALIVAYDYPTALTDVNAFSTQFSLPLFNQGGSSPTFTRVAQDGTQGFPSADTTGTWGREAALDIEWAHAMAPQANLILVEASGIGTFPNYPLIQNAADWARHQPGVSVISMSFSSGDSFNDTTLDQYLTTPSAHQGITFVASTGDNGAPAGYPACSPNVVGVGGTSLVLSGGQYGSETGWNLSGGGISVNEIKPWYQGNVTQSATQRTAPDIAMDGNPSTGVAVYDSYNYPGSPWITLGGTSLAAPLFAGVMAVANQGRASYGLGTLDGFSQTLPLLYKAPAADFHDITSGSNGTYSAGPGYDLVTGIGSPIANLLIPYLVGVAGSISGTTYQDKNANATYDGGDGTLAGLRVYIDANNNGTYDLGGTQTQASGTINLTIPNSSTVGRSSPLTVAGLSGPISDVNVTLSITHAYDTQLSAYLIGPDGTKITLFSGVGSYVANFTNTTLDDQAATAITLGSAPFTGSFVPQWLLAAFNGKNANGTWQLKVTDSGTTAALANWSLTVTTAAEQSTLTAADGSYALGPLPAGSYTVREMGPPAGYQAVGTLSQAVNLAGNVTGVNFGQVQTTYNSTTSGDTFYLWMDQGSLALGKSAGAANSICHLPAGVALNFSLTTPGSKLVLDFLNGSPIPGGNIQVDGGGLSDSEVQIFGAGATLTMSDAQIGPTTGGFLSYANLGTMSLWNSTVNYGGNLSTLQYLNVNEGTYFFWR